MSRIPSTKISSIEIPSIERLFHIFLKRLHNKSINDLVITYLSEMGIPKWDVPYYDFETHIEYYKYKFACVLLADNPIILSRMKFDASSVEPKIFRAVVRNKCIRVLKYLFKRFPGYHWWRYTLDVWDCYYRFDIRDVPLFKLLMSHGFIYEMDQLRHVCEIRQRYNVADYICLLLCYWNHTPRSLKWYIKRICMFSLPFYFNKYDKECIKIKL